eukprot:755164-Hanusia_phi.AAC.2
MPPIQPFYRTKPAQLISHLIGHEGPDCLSFHTSPEEIRVSREEVLCANELFFEEFDEDQNFRINHILDNFLKSSNMRIVMFQNLTAISCTFTASQHLTCPENELPQNFLDGQELSPPSPSPPSDPSSDPTFWVEKYFGTRFCHLSGSCECSSLDVVKKMSLPPVNPYLPSDTMHILTEELKDGDLPDVNIVPDKIFDNSFITGWHLLDVSFKVPRASIFLSLNSPVSDESAPPPPPGNVGGLHSLLHADEYQLIVFRVSSPSTRGDTWQKKLGSVWRSRTILSSHLATA